MKKQFVVAAMAVLALAWAKPSSADVISFDVNGTGGGTGTIAQATRFDWAPGNSLLIEDPGGLTATVLFQANLQAINALPASQTYLNGSTYEGVQGAFITAVASFRATLNAAGGFNVIPGGGVFNIYADAEEGNDLSGKGFALDPGAVLILSGTAVSGSGSLTPTGGTTTLDQFLGDSYGGVQTIRGSGGISDIVVAVTFANSNYFLSVPNQILFTATSSGSNNLPFTQVDPSALFSSNAVADGDQAGVSAVGPINGLGSTIIAESDASSTFTTSLTAVPEPASLTLLGLGLAGSAAARRRKKAQQQA